MSGDNMNRLREALEPALDLGFMASLKRKPTNLNLSVSLTKK